MSEYTYLVSPDFNPEVIPEGYIWNETAFQELVKATDKATADQTIYTYGGPQGGSDVDYLNAADLTISDEKYNGEGQVVDTTITANAFNNAGTVTTEGTIAFAVKSFTNFGEFNLDKNGALTATSTVMNMEDGTINLNAGTTLQGSTVVNGGAITVVSDHATITGAITNNGVIDALMKKLIVTGDIQNANEDDTKLARDATVITAREFEVAGNVLNYGAIGIGDKPIHTMSVTGGALSNYHQLIVDVLTADSIYNDSVQSEVEEKRTRGYIDAGEVNAGSIDNVSGTIKTHVSKEGAVGINVTGTINNGNADNVFARIETGLNGWVQAASLNNIGTDIENSLVDAKKLTVGDITNNGGISTRIVEATGTITNNATGLFFVCYIDDPIVTQMHEAASLTAGTIVNGGTVSVYSEADLPTPVTVTSIENSGLFEFNGAGFTLTGDIFNKTEGQIDVAGTVTGTATITNSGTLNISDDDDVSGALTAGSVTNTETGTINLNAGTTLQGSTVVNGGAITVVSDHATITGAITNNGVIDALMKKLIVTGDIQNANEDDTKLARDATVITAREFEVAGNVLNYGAIGIGDKPIHTMSVTGGALSNYHQLIVDVLTADSIYNDSVQSEVEEKRTRGYIDAGEVNAGSIDNVSGTIKTHVSKEGAVGINVTGTINNGNADNVFARIETGLNGWVQAASLNNIGTDIENSLVDAKKLTVGDITNNGGISTRIVEATGTITNNATGLFFVCYIDDPIVTQMHEAASLTAGTIINGGTVAVYSEAALPTPVNVTLIENSGLFEFTGAGFTLTGDVVNDANGRIDVAGTVTGSTATITNSGTLNISDDDDVSGALTVGAVTNSGMIDIAIQAGQGNKIISDEFYNTEGVGKITISGSCDDGVTSVISAKEGDIRVSDITLSVTSKSGEEVTVGVHGGNVALATGIDYRTIYLSNGIDEDAIGSVVKDNTGASYYVDFNAFKLPASALEDGVRDVTTTILIDGTDPAALKYESVTLAAIDGLTFAKDGTNAALPGDEEKNIEFVLTGMDPVNPESYRDLKTGITIGEGVTLTVDKLHQTGEDAVTNIDGELRIGTPNSGIKKTPGAKSVVMIDTFRVEAGQVNVNDGGALYDCTVLTGGTVAVYEGGYAEGIAMASGGRLDVCEGGVASAATVDFGGDLYVSDGGKALRVMENGGYVNFDEEDAEVTFVSNSFSGLTLYGLNWATVHSGTTATDITANSRGTLQIFSSGLANNATVNSSGRVHVYEGGTVNKATVNSDGEFTVSSGGTATGINASAGARLDLVVAPDTYVQGAYAGSAFEIKDASLADYTVQSNCWLGASAGGVVSNATVADGGKLYTFDGGIAIAPTVDVGGVLYLYENTGSAYEIRENGGAVFGEVTEIVSFASNTFSGAVLEDWREATVHSGTTATDTTVNADGGLYVFEGGVARATIVNSEGVLALHDGGIASDATVNVGGEIHISSGGMAHLIRENGGYVEVEDGATVSFVSNTISGLDLNEYEYATVHSGTTATDVSVNSECELEVFSGGIADDVAVNADGALFVYDGGIASIVTVNEKGGLCVTGGGTANDVTVNPGGMAEVSSGVIDGTVVNSGGSLLIYRGTRLTGRMTFESGAEVIPFVGSVLDFDLTQTSAGSVALVNDLSILMGKPSYTLTVDGSESDGTYRLAGGAAGFNESITVVNNSGSELGTLTVGADLDIDGKIYTLALNGSDLSVTIDPSNKPDDGTNDLLYDKKNETWNDANITVENWISASSLVEDDTVYLDVPGSIEQPAGSIVMHNMVGYNTPDPDTGDTARIFVEDSAKLTFQIDSTVSGAFYVYEKVYDNKNGAYRQVQIGKVSVKKDKSAYLEDICVTGDGNYFVQMAADSSAYKKEGATGYYNVTVASAKFFDDVDNGWNESYANALVQVEPVHIGRETSFVALDDNVESAADWNFIGGITDVADFARIRLDSSAFLSFDVIGDDDTSDGSAKFTIWKFNGTKGLKKVTSVTLKPGKYGQTTKGVFLDRDEEYYISMESTDAAKGKDIYYKVEVNALGTRFFDSADDNRNNVLYDKTHKDVYGEDKTHHFFVNKVSSTGSPDFFLDDNEIGLEGFGNFVGYGDKVDYAKFTVTEKGKLSFTVTATEGATFEVWTLNNGKMKSLGKTKLKLARNATTCTGTISNLLLEVGTEYYVSMTAAKTTANTKGSVFYNVTATLVAQNASSLAMPETSDALAVTDAPSFGQYDTDVLAGASAGAYPDSASDKLLVESENGLLASL